MDHAVIYINADAKIVKLPLHFQHKIYNIKCGNEPSGSIIYGEFLDWMQIG